jgi:uncharacterized RDD family membrane protein YckC
MGPVDEETFSSLVSSGTITTDTLVWKDGMDDWQPYGRIATAVGEAADVPASLFGEQQLENCAECGRPFPNTDMVAYESHWVCAECKDVFFQRIREGGAVLGTLNYAGFWIRFGAWMIDFVILFFIGMVQSMVQAALTGGFGFDPNYEPTGTDLAISLAFSALSFVVGLAYGVYFVGKFAATPGKLVLGLRIVRSDGSRVSYWRAAGRYFATILSSFTLMIGYIIAAFDSEKRTLHDHICDTRVIHK